jgi:endonuclease/exonuclease/phosphatase family metal-dependent hydrolase
MERRRLLAVLAGVTTISILLAVGSHGTPAAPTLAAPARLRERAPDVRHERLCRDAARPDAARDVVHIDCALESSTRLGPTPSARDELSVVTFNLERGFEADAQIGAFRRGQGVPPPDVLLVSEADRGCSRSGHRNVMRDYAEALGMNYVFAVEYVELPRLDGPGRRIDAPCEHGNGILSRYPIESPQALRFSANRSWYVPKAERARHGEPRLGGRVALGASIRVGTRRVQAWSLHLESGLFDGALRAAQLDELAGALARQGGPTVVGGDTNLHAYALDLLFRTGREPALARIEAAGLRDAHRGLWPVRRSTHRGLVVIDLILSNLDVAEAGVAPWRPWGGLSDHLPVWSRLRLPS